MDFVVGIEVRLSGNHTCDGKIFYDICDELKGKYPKDFKFTGWHPQCRCYAVSILKTDKELDKDFDRMLEGEEPMSGEESKNAVEDVPKQFKDWVEENKKKINTAKSLPYFVKDNRRAVDRIMKSPKGEKSGKTKSQELSEERKRIADKLEEINRPRDKKTFVSFDPFSPILIEKLNEFRDKKYKLMLFEELLNDDAFEVIHIAENGAKTVIHPMHKTKDKFWKQTLDMAKELNRLGKDVIFLPEYNDITSADALILFKEIPTIVDFKYSETTKWNSLQFALKEGFEQATTLVLKLEEMDAGQFKDTINYMKRNNMFIGNILLMNQYGKGLELSYKDIKSKKYELKIKGFFN